MYLVPVTAAGRKVLDSYNQLPRDSRSLKERLLEALLMPLAAAILIADTFLDLGSNPELTTKWGLLGIGLGIGNCIAMYVRRCHRRNVEQRYNHLCEAGDIVAVDAEIEHRWYDLCWDLDIEDEPRAEIENFPEALRKVVVLQKARKSNPVRTTRKMLDNRIIEIICEALEPLATELAVLRELEDEEHAIIVQANLHERETLRLVREAGQKAEAETLLLAS